MEGASERNTVLYDSEPVRDNEKREYAPISLLYRPSARCERLQAKLSSNLANELLGLNAIVRT